MKKLVLIIAVIAISGFSFKNATSKNTSTEKIQVALSENRDDNASGLNDKEKDKKKTKETAKKTSDEKATTKKKAESATGCTESQKKSCAASQKSCCGEKK